MSEKEVILARRYVLLDRIGVGGMGEVWRVHDQLTNTTVAAKILRPPIAAAPAAEVRFQREIHAMARLNHPRVVPIIDAGRDPSLGLFFVMELQTGIPLQDAAHEWTSWSQVAPIADQILETLGHAHAQSVVHRDIKPDNILINPGHEAMLLDFGVARMRDRARSGTSAYDLLGTVDYAAPEQATGNRRRIGPWTDLYCFGIVLFEIVCGRMPFWASSPVQALIMRLDRGCPKLEPRPGFETPVGLWEVLDKMLQPEPFQRFRCVADARAAFNALSDRPIEVLTPAIEGLSQPMDFARREQKTDNELSIQMRHRHSLLSSSFEARGDAKPPRPPLRTTTLVGRDDLLMDLSKGLSKWLTKPVPGVLVISGEEGSGKSRLLREMVSPFVAQGEIDGHHHRWAYGASLKEIALSICGALGLVEETLEEHLEWWLDSHTSVKADHSELMSWLIADDSTLNVDGDGANMALFLRGCCHRKPFVLAIDSVGAFDSEAIALVDSIRANSLPIIVIFTCVAVQWSDGCVAPEWFSAAHRELKPLNETQLGRILDGVAELPEELRLELINLAEGNPERLLEAVHYARRQSRVIPAWPAWRAAPFGWRALDESLEEEAGLDSLEMSVLASPDFDS